MSIQCQKCAYVMAQAEAMGYFSAEVYQIFKNVIVPVLITMYLKRNLKQTVADTVEILILGILNTSEIKCHVCHKYVGWSIINDHSIDHQTIQKEL